jgi:FMN phosphatase YigB (HAD superfamily)
MIKYLVWDIGGVLLENPFIGEFWKEKIGSDKLRHDFGSGKISNKEFIKKASKLIGINEKIFLEKYGEAYFPIKKIDCVFEIFEKLKNKSYLFSDTNPIHLKFIKEKYADMFNGIKGKLMSSELGYRKKEDKFYEILIRKINVGPKEILLIDDSKLVVDKARSHNLNAILFTNCIKLREDLKNYRVDF